VTLDEALDELYGAPLAAFVAERKRLAKELPAEERDAFTALRKPSVAAWTLNQLARRHRRDVDLLLDAGHRLREAQAGALDGGEGSGFETARKAELEARRGLKGKAQLISQERGRTSTAVLDQVEESLRAAAISEDGRELLARGRFVEPIRAEGFDVVSRIAAAADPRRTPRSAKARDERREAEAGLEQARSKLRDAEQAAREAERNADRLDAESARARRSAADARAEAELAAADVEAAERRVKRLRGR
jgi:hypothetical protein